MSTPHTLHIAAELNNLAAIRAFVREAAEGMGAGPEVIQDVLLAVTEAATNTIEHGYRRGTGDLDVVLWREGEAIIVRIRDRAPLHDPLTAAPPDLDLPLDQRPLGGMGVHFIKTFMDEVRYRVTAQGENELTLVKHLSQGGTDVRD